MEDKALVKTEGDTNAGVDAYTVLDTLNKVKAEALVYTHAFKFPQVGAKSVTVTVVERISYTLSVRQ